MSARWFIPRGFIRRLRCAKICGRVAALNKLHAEHHRTWSWCNERSARQSEESKSSILLDFAKDKISRYARRRRWWDVLALSNMKQNIAETWSAADSSRNALPLQPKPNRSEAILFVRHSTRRLKHEWAWKCRCNPNSCPIRACTRRSFSFTNRKRNQICKKGIFMLINANSSCSIKDESGWRNSIASLKKCWMRWWFDFEVFWVLIFSKHEAEYFWCSYLYWSRSFQIFKICWTTKNLSVKTATSFRLKP